VIAVIVATISRKQGAGIKEIVAVLAKSFPDRDPDAMTETARTQVGHNATHKSREEKRGLVYYRKGLLEEENKLGHDWERLEFAENRAAVCRLRADRRRHLLNSFAHGTSDWMQAERLLLNFESLAQFVEGFCRQMRRQMNEIPL
jgi:hypothetical protein